MPIDKDLKRLVRARMAATNQNYTTARAALVTPVARVDLRALVSKLANPATAQAAAATLRAQPPERLVPALVAGLRSSEWRGGGGGRRVGAGLASSPAAPAPPPRPPPRPRAPPRGVPGPPHPPPHTTTR